MDEFIAQKQNKITKSELNNRKKDICLKRREK